MFIDFSPEKKSHIKTEIMKSLKTRNKSPVHYKYTWQRCANQSYLSAEGDSHQGCLAVPAQRQPSGSPPAGSTARPAVPRHTHAGQRLGHHRHALTAGQRAGRRLVSVESTYWSVSGWECARDLANGSLQADPWTHWEPGWDLHTEIGLQDWATRESAAPFMDFIFFKIQLFNLSSWYGRTDATFDFCLVWLQRHP